MARPQTNTVEYFPHMVNHGKAMYIIEERFGNDGYAFWFRLLEMLGSTDNHYIDCRDSETWEYVIAKSRVNDEAKVQAMLDLFSRLGCIDQELWTSRVIWCGQFVDNIKDAYANRRRPMPGKPVITGKNITCEGVSTGRNDSQKGVSTDENTQSKVNESIDNNRAWGQPDKNDGEPPRDGDRKQLHDGTWAVRRYGVWMDAENTTIAINTAYYPEVAEKT